MTITDYLTSRRGFGETDAADGGRGDSYWQDERQQPVDSPDGVCLEEWSELAEVHHHKAQPHEAENPGYPTARRRQRFASRIGIGARSPCPPRVQGAVRPGHHHMCVADLGRSTPCGTDDRSRTTGSG